MRVFVLVGWIAWLTSSNLGLSAIVQEDLLTMSNLKRVSPPQDMSLPNGYEVVAEPTADAKPIKVMPPGLAKVAANLDVGGQRYYMTDWSYERFREGMSYNWIRPLRAGAAKPAPTKVLAEVEPKTVAAQELHLGAPLRHWLSHLADGEKLKFMESSGRRLLFGKFDWRKDRVTVFFEIPGQIKTTDPEDMVLHSLPCTMIYAVNENFAWSTLKSIPPNGDEVMDFLKGNGSGKLPWLFIDQSKKENLMQYAMKSGEIIAIVELALLEKDVAETMATRMTVKYIIPPPRGPARQGKLVRSRLHGVSVNVNLPQDWTNKIEVIEEGKLQSMDIAYRDVMRSVVFQCDAGADETLSLAHLSDIPAKHHPTVAEIEQHHMGNTVIAGQSFGRLQRARVTFLGKPAHAVLADYKAGFPEKHRMAVVIVSMEPVNGRFYSLSCGFTPDSSVKAMSLQDFAACLTLVPKSQ